MDRWFLGALLGTLLSPWLVPTWPVWPFASATLGVAFLLYRAKWLKPQHFALDIHLSSLRHAGLLFCMGVLCGMQWSLINAQMALSWNLPEHLHRQTLTVQVRIDSIVDDNGFRWRFDALAMPTESSLLEDKVKLRLQWYEAQGEQPKLGDIWLLDVRLRPAVSRLNQASFNYQSSLLRQQVRATGYVIQGHRLAPGQGLRARLQRWRQYYYDEFSARRDWFAYSHILLALTLAERHWMSAAEWQLLQHTGVAHLMAISGLHLSMVFAFSFMLSRWLLAWLVRLAKPQARPLLLLAALVIAWCCAFLYAALADFSVATLRALLLISCVLLMRMWGLHTSPIRIWLRAVVLVLLLDPLAFLDAGFWLSCLAVLSIFVWLWRLPAASMSGWIAKTRQLWRFEVMLSLMLLPLSVMFFNGVSIIAPLTNVVVIPVFSMLVLPFALVSLLLMPVYPVLASVALHISDQVLQWVWSLLSGLQPWAFWGTSNAYAVLLCLAAVLIVYLPVSRRSRLGLLSSTIGSLLVLTVVQPSLRNLDPRLWLHMLDVGQGSALVVERGGRALLIDSGPGYQDFNLANSLLIPFLQKRQLTPDLMVLTHPHSDHIGAASDLIKQFPEMSVLDTAGDYLPCQWGMPWHWQDVDVHILAPTSSAFYGANNQSCVLQLRYQGQAVMLPGDIERLGEFRLVRHYGARLKSNVLLVPHHGSRTSSHRYFLEQVAPEWALLSAGYLNRFNMPHPESLQRLAEVEAHVLATAENGQVSLLWYRGAWHPLTYRGHFAPYWFNQIR